MAKSKTRSALRTKLGRYLHLESAERNKALKEHFVAKDPGFSWLPAIYANGNEDGATFPSAVISRDPKGGAETLPYQLHVFNSEDDFGTDDAGFYDFADLNSAIAKAKELGFTFDQDSVTQLALAEKTMRSNIAKLVKEKKLKLFHGRKWKLGESFDDDELPAPAADYVDGAYPAELPVEPVASAPEDEFYGTVPTGLIVKDGEVFIGPFSTPDEAQATLGLDTELVANAGGEMVPLEDPELSDVDDVSDDLEFDDTEFRESDRAHKDTSTLDVADFKGNTKVKSAIGAYLTSLPPGSDEIEVLMKQVFMYGLDESERLLVKDIVTKYGLTSSPESDLDFLTDPEWDKVKYTRDFSRYYARYRKRAVRESADVVYADYDQWTREVAKAVGSNWQDKTKIQSPNHLEVRDGDKLVACWMNNSGKIYVTESTNKVNAMTLNVKKLRESIRSKILKESELNDIETTVSMGQGAENGGSGKINDGTAGAESKETDSTTLKTSDAGAAADGGPADDANANQVGDTKATVIGGAGGVEVADGTADLGSVKESLSEKYLGAARFEYVHVRDKAGKVVAKGFVESVKNGVVRVDGVDYPAKDFTALKIG